MLYEDAKVICKVMCVNFLNRMFFVFCCFLLTSKMFYCSSR